MHDRSKVFQHRAERMMRKTRDSKIARIFALVAAAVLAGAAMAAAQTESLSLGSKHWAPTVISKSGIGTANAMAEAKVTRQEIEGWCANWTPEDKNCVRRTLASEEARKTYRASADCMRGRITPVDGKTYTLAGPGTAATLGRPYAWRDHRERSSTGHASGDGHLAAVEVLWESAVVLGCVMIVGMVLAMHFLAAAVVDPWPWLGIHRHHAQAEHDIARIGVIRLSGLARVRFYELSNFVTVSIPHP